MGTFEYFEHTADIGITASGHDLKEAFAAAGLALFSLITDLDDVREEVRINVSVEADDPESLLVAWLNELIFVFDVEHLLLRRFEMQRLEETEIQARCHGERFDPERHCLKVEVKAATYHQVRVDRLDEGYRVQVIVDV